MSTFNVEKRIMEVVEEIEGTPLRYRDPQWNEGVRVLKSLLDEGKLPRVMERSRGTIRPNIDQIITQTLTGIANGETTYDVIGMPSVRSALQTHEKTLLRNTFFYLRDFNGIFNIGQVRQLGDDDIEGLEKMGRTRKFITRAIRDSKPGPTS